MNTRRRLEMRPEGGAESPFWDETGTMVDLEDLPLSDELRRRLETWADLAWWDMSEEVYEEGRRLHQEVERTLHTFEVVWDAE